MSRFKKKAGFPSFAFDCLGILAGAAHPAAVFERSRISVNPPTYRIHADITIHPHTVTPLAASLPTTLAIAETTYPIPTNPSTKNAINSS